MRVLLLLGFGVVAACGGNVESDAPEPAATEMQSLEEIQPVATTSEEPRVIFLGDSLTAGYGLPEGEAFPARVGEILAAEGTPIEIINAGVSGDTSAGGVTRVDWLLRQAPDVLVVGLGANDGLRGHSLATTEANLRRIIEAAQAAGADVVLLGMKIPPSHGLEYFEAFEGMYPRLAAEFDVELVDFLLEGVAARPELNLEDGIHPNTEGQGILAENVVPALKTVLADSH